MTRILIAIFLALSVLDGCRCNASGGSAGVAPMAKSGAETWEVDGKTIKVASTYYLTLPEGLQFTVDVEVPAGTQFDGMTGDKAFELAFPAMRHAYEKRLFERSKITKVGAGEQQVARIGVSLFTPDKFGNHGYRVSRTLEEIQKRIAGG